jgi:hypothetical protein
LGSVDNAGIINKYLASTGKGHIQFYEGILGA